MLRNVVGINSWSKNLRNLSDVWSFPLRSPTLRHFRSVRVVLHSDFPSFHLPSHHHQLQIFHVQSWKDWRACGWTEWWLRNTRCYYSATCKWRHERRTGVETRRRGGPLFNIWGPRSAVCFHENTLIIGFINIKKSLFSGLSVISRPEVSPFDLSGCEDLFWSQQIL